MAQALAAMVDRELDEHSAVKANPEWKALANRAVEALNDLYQAIGAQHVQEPAHAATGVRPKALTVGKPMQQR